MLPKYHEILHPYNIGLVLLVSLLDMTQYFNLKESLFGALWLIFDDFDSNMLFILMVNSFYNLSIRSFANGLDNLISIRYMITLNVFVQFA